MRSCISTLYLRRAGLWYKIATVLAGLLSMLILNPGAFSETRFWALMLPILAIQALCTGLMASRAGEGQAYPLWLLSASANLGFAAVVLSHSGGLISPLMILYPIVLVDIVAAGPSLKEFAYFGAFGHLTFALALRGANGSWDFYLGREFWLHSLAMGLFFVGSLFVVSETRKLSDLAATDSLTGLNNRRYLMQRLQEELSRAERSEKSLSLLMLDIDDFKNVNNHLGHPVGDEILKQVAMILRDVVRPGDGIFRYGGDEFVILLPGTSLSQARGIGERIRRRVSTTTWSLESMLPGGSLTVSIGVSSYPLHARNPEGLIDKADKALVFGAKRHAKDSVQVFSRILDVESGWTDREGRRFLPEELDVVLSVINAKDRYTYRHSQRVAYHAETLARKIGLPEVEVNLIWAAGLLHDVGKIEIPGELLMKTGELSPGEWQIIKNHPLFGIAMLTVVRGTADLVPAIKHHHERFDGKGYPDGLAGEEIPLAARILALADSYDAMLTERPYRKPLSIEEIICEIESQSGKQFDPQLARVFIEIIRQGEALVKADKATAIPSSTG